MLAALRGYQNHGIAWLVAQLEQHKAVLLADDPGLGKTIQALRAAAELDADRVLILCPAGARRVWQREIERWLPQWSKRVFLVEPGIPIDRLRWRLIDREPLILIVGYDTLSDFKNPVGQWLQRLDSWSVLICDEAHYLKNFSNRTKAVYGWGGSGNGIQSHAKRVILLTGTPSPNHAGELYTHCRTFWPWACPGLKSQASFEEAYTRFKDTKWGRQVVGSKNQQILRQALAEVVLRRRKAEVLEELPPLQIRDVPLPPTRLAVREMEESYRAAFEGLDDDEFLAALRAVRSDEDNLARLRHQLGLAKAPLAVAWIREQLDSVDKLLVFGWHRDVLEEIVRGLGEFKPAVITGETPPKTRAEMVDRFQTDPNTRVFVGQILAAGVAITLTAASEVALVECSWVPGENLQAIGRAHRLGQRDSVLASFLFLPDSLDERIMSIFRRKADEIAQLQGDPSASLDESDSRSGDYSWPSDAAAAFALVGPGRTA